jgi:hypothetical protein
MRIKKDLEFYIDQDYSKKADWCNNYNCHIEEIESDNDKRKFKIVENKDNSLQVEYFELLDWFNNTYTYQEQKYRRLVALGKTDDDGNDASEKLAALYIKAEKNRKRIQKLEEEQQ